MRVVCVRITGRVLGVGFRAWTRRQALLHGLCGWVRNEPDGSVKALLDGSIEAVEAMLADLRQGPPGAVVRTLEAVAADPAEAPTGFSITR